nr:PREDICTED: polyprenol reductase-like [Linepithema humile]
MDINIIRWTVIFYTFIYTGLGLLVNYMESYLSPILIRLYRYGKFSANTNQSIISKIEMPKKWFGHCYILTGPLFTTLLYFALNRYFFSQNIPESLLSLLDIFLGTSRKPLVSAENTILATVLLAIHGYKRAYETYYVCVYSDKKINILYYVIIYLHYATTSLSIIGESELFVRGSHVGLLSHKLTIMELMCALIFLLSTYLQLRTNVIFAGLRKNQHGDIVTKEHKIAFGELFNYISNPLQLTEIILYLTLSVILWPASTFHYITIFVVLNQIETAYLSHQWYQNTFKNYPKERKILIPFIW